jgi:type II secretory pathway component PulM
MKLPLRKLWESRTPRERAVMVVLAIVTMTALYLWFVQSAGHARERLRTTVTTLRIQAVQIDQQAVELGRLRTAPALSVSQTGLQSLLQDQIGAAGLSRALVSLDVRNADQVVIVFGAVAFADWLKWLTALKSQHVRVDACRIEALSTPGLVSVTATLVRAPPP